MIFVPCLGISSGCSYPIIILALLVVVKLVKVAHRASLLKSDNVRLKRMTHSFRWRACFDLSEEENAKHISIH